MFLIGFAILVVVSSAVTVWLIVYFDPKSIEKRCLGHARQAELLLDVNAAEVRRVCQRCRKELTEVARRSLGYERGPVFFPDKSRGTEALAIVHVCLAVIDYREGLLSAVDQSLSYIRQRFGDSAEGRQWLFRYYIRTGQICEEAVKTYVHMLARGLPADMNEEAGRIRARFLAACQIDLGMSQSELKARLRWTRAAQRFFSSESWPWLNEGQALFRVGDMAAAKKAFTTTAHRFRDCVEARIWLARAVGADGDKQQALRMLTALADSLNSDPATLVRVAEGLAGCGCWKEAVSVFKKIPVDDPSLRTVSHLTRAKIYLHGRNTEKALALLSEAAHQNPGDIQIAMLLAEAHSLLGDPAAALQVLEGTIPLETRVPQQQMALGAAYWNCGQYEKALGWFQRAMHGEHRATEARLYAGRCLIRLERFTQAKGILKTEQKQSPIDQACILFYRGVVLVRMGNPTRALKQFSRAYELARAEKCGELSLPAGRNALWCYSEIARDFVRNKDYAQAAKALEILSENLRSDPERIGRITHSIIECLVHAAVESFERGGSSGAQRGIEFLQRAVHLKPTARLRGILGGFHASVEQYDQAIGCYDDVLREFPENSAARFARALCIAKGRSRERGIAELTAVCDEGQRYALRAALALADDLAQQNQFGEAAQILLRTIRSVTPEDPYYGEACCRLILNTVRDDRINDAKRLAVRLLRTGDESQADAILGTLLAHEARYEMALPYLATGVPPDATETLAGDILRSVYQRVAAEKCTSGDFTAASKLLSRAAQRFSDPELRQLADLAYMAANSGKGHAELDQGALELLAAVYKASPNPHPVIARAMGVGVQRFARDLTIRGKHGDARPLWSQADVLWIQRIGPDQSFWADFIESYNQGKQYQLKISPQELRRRVFERMAMLHTGIMRDALHGMSGRASVSDHKVHVGPPLLDIARMHWQESKRLIGPDSALQLVNEHIALLPLVEVNNFDMQVRLFDWWTDNVEALDGFRDYISEQAFRRARDAMMEGDISAFLSDLELSGRTDPDFQPLVERIHRLGQRAVRRIVDEVNSHPFGRQVRRDDPDVFRTFLYRIIAIYATVDFETSLGPEDVPLYLERVMEFAVEQIRESQGA